MRQLNGFIPNITIANLIGSDMFSSGEIKQSWSIKTITYLNPIRAHMMKDMRELPWSSYLSMIGVNTPPDWLQVNWILSRFSLQRK
ncbi:MAG: hypothetical protein ACI845_000635 [Gammaproteobacteria bacterium]|jgi:hypothetical protein